MSDSRATGSSSPAQRESEIHSPEVETKRNRRISEPAQPPHRKAGSLWHQFSSFMARRARAGSSRARESLLPAASSALAAVGAFAFARIVLGHDQPIFAATSALIALGFGRDPRLRKVLEVSIGCTLGVMLGDVIQSLLGQGYLQGLLVVFVSIILARFLDSGVIFTTQMSLQAVLVVLLPLPGEGIFDRSLDAVVGGLLALIITMIMPKNLRAGTSESVREVFTTTTKTLHELAAAIRDGDSRAGWLALVQSRSTQKQFDELEAVVQSNKELATYSPIARKARGRLKAIEQKLPAIDLALRSLRIVSRRAITVIDEVALDDEGAELMSEWLDEAADAVSILGRSLSEPAVPGLHRSLSVARDALGAAATRLNPAVLGADNLQAEALVMLCRPMMVDFLVATGATNREANSYLPEL